MTIQKWVDGLHLVKDTAVQGPTVAVANLAKCWLSDIAKKIFTMTPYHFQFNCIQMEFLKWSLAENTEAFRILPPIPFRRGVFTKWVFKIDSSSKYWDDVLKNVPWYRERLRRPQRARTDVGGQPRQICQQSVAAESVHSFFGVSWTRLKVAILVEGSKFLSWKSKQAFSNVRLKRIKKILLGLLWKEAPSSGHGYY